MKFNTNWRVIVLIFMTMTASAQSDSTKDEIAQLKTQLKILTQQVNDLEARLSQAENLQINEPTPESTQPDNSPKDTSKQSRIRFSGDFRGRYDYADKRQQPVRQRSRIRMRLAAEADINEDISVLFRLATGGDNPTSTNQTLDGSFSNKDIRLDRAYVNYNLTENDFLTGGKMKNPFYRIGGTGVLFDGDLNPEGLAVNHKSKQWQAALGVFYLDERKNDDEVMLYGGQMSRLGSFENSQYQFGLGYYDYDNLQGSEPLYNGETLGNRFDADNRLQNDFNIVEVFSGWQTDWHNRPLKLFATYLKNTAADDLNSAYLGGFSYGSAKIINQWQVGYQYWYVEADAVYALFNDSDFADGFTDSRGHLWALSYGLMDNITIGISYFDTRMFMDLNNPISYDRLFLDVNYQFK